MFEKKLAVLFKEEVVEYLYKNYTDEHSFDSIDVVKGAEFGYRKALEQVKQILKEWLSDKTYTPKQHSVLVQKTENFIKEAGE